MSEPEGYWISAVFNPKSRDSLRPESAEFIGQVFKLMWVGTGSADEPYPGQWRWQTYGPPPVVFPWWIPHEDLEVIEYSNKPL